MSTPARHHQVAARAAMASARAVGRGVAVARGIHDGVVLGLLGDDSLDALDARYYDGEPMYAGDEHNRRGFFDWERQAIDTWFPRHGRIVATGVGGGREAIALDDLGYDVIAYEPHDGLRAIANQALGSARVRPAPRHGFPTDLGPDDELVGIVTGWSSYMLLRGSDRRIAFLTGARAVLPTGAPVLLSFFVRADDGVYFRAVQRTGSVVRRCRRRPPVELGDACQPNYVHCFTRAELEYELRQAGFTLAHFSNKDYGHAIALAD